MSTWMGLGDIDSKILSDMEYGKICVPNIAHPPWRIRLKGDHKDLPRPVVQGSKSAPRCV